MSSIKRSDLDVVAYGTSYLTHAGRPHLMSQVLSEVEQDDHVTAAATILRRVIERQKLLTTTE